MKRIRRALALVMAVCILGGTTVQTAEAAEKPVDMRPNTWMLTEAEREGKTIEEVVEIEKKNEEEATKKAYEMEVATNELKNWPQGPGTYGEGVIVMEAKSGAILYSKNIDGKGYPASITKILTALVALENAKLDDKITVTADSVAILGNGYAHIGLTPGEEISLKDALYALMLASANEVAYAIGESVGEGYDWFLEEMNRRAKELGAVNSNFLNTNGMQEEEHYTTARDMALITQELLEHHKEFQTISQTLEYKIAPTNLCKEERVFQQVHKVFYDENTYYYPKATAGKTGYTDEAMNTLVTCAADENLELICVILKAHGTHVYPDTLALLDYGFDNFKKVDIAENETSKDIEEVEKGAYVVLPEGVSFDKLQSEITPDEKDKTKGTVTYTWEGNPVGKAEVTFSRSYLNKHDIKVTLHKEKKAEPESGWTLKKVILTAVIVLIVLLVLWMIFAAFVRKKRREERLRRKRRRQQMAKKRRDKQKKEREDRRR